MPPRLSRVESVLLERGVVSREALEAARERQRGAKRPLLEVLLEQRSVDEGQLVRAVEESFGRPALSPEALKPDPEVQSYVPAETAQRLGILPLHFDDGVLVLATSDPFQLPAFDAVAARHHVRVRPEFAPPSAVRRVLRASRLGEEALDEILKNSSQEDGDLVFDPASPSRAGQPEPDEEASGGGEGGAAAQHLEVLPEDAPVTRLVSMILADGIRQGASDVHIEAEQTHVRVRFRIDGDLREVLTVPATLHHRILARIKIVCGLDIIETRRPQDGRAQVASRGMSYDLRVSTMPSYYGEKVVLRILDKENRSFDLGPLGIDEQIRARWSALLRRPNGLLLLTGPTGSGKTTTLYASLLEILEPTKNIVTVEDPVEYQFPGIVHVPVRSEIGMTFASALRSILRQDPDIILLGEIRDEETAQVALRAAQTGHLVLSTLHTNDAIGAVSRLRDLDVSPHLLSTCLIGVMSQRLVKTICPECARPHIYEPDELAALMPPGANLDASGTRKGDGCANCHGTGLRGRTAIVELIEVTPDLRRLIHEGANEAALMEQAELDGRVSLGETGLRKVLAGECGPHDVARYGAGGASRLPAGRAVPSGSALATGTAARDGRSCTSCGQPVRAGWTHCSSCTAPVVDDDPATRRLLVCDDDRVQRMIVARALGADFGVIDEAENGQEALDAIARERPELLVIDQNMPVRTGVEVIRTLRSRLQTVDLPILMLTGVTAEDLETEALDAGADDYLLKPVDAKRLRGRVLALLASRRPIAAGADD